MKCVVKLCNVRNNMWKRIYKFPIDEPMRRKWFEAVGIMSTECIRRTSSIGVCEDHFPPGSHRYERASQAFETKSRLRPLRPDAVPILDSTVTISDLSEVEVQAELSTSNASVRNEDDGDLFQCGKCQRQFFALKLFLDHKRTCCSSPMDQIAIRGSATTLEFLNPSVSCDQVVSHGDQCPTTEFPSVVMNEAEFLSLTGIELSSLAIPNLSAVAVSNVFVSNAPSPSECTTRPTELNLASERSPQPTDFELSSQSHATDVTCMNNAQSEASTPAPIKKHLAPTLPNDSRTTESCSLKAVCQRPSQTESFSDSCSIPLYGESNSCTSSLMKEAGDVLVSAKEATERGHADCVAEDFFLRENKSERGVSVSLDGSAKIGIALLPIKCAGVEQHTRIPSTNQMNLQCTYCDKLFTKNFDLQQHVRSHTGEKPFQCIVCGKAFAQKSNVKKHMSTHKVWPTELLNVLPCQLNCAVNQSAQKTQKECGDSSADNQLKPEADVGVKQVISHTYYCQFCNACFSTYCRLKSHLNSHNNHKVYRCVVNTCGKTFQELDVFLDHAKTHVNEKSYRCHVCNKTFLTLYDYGLHQHAHQAQCKETDRARRFKCTKCIKQFATEEALEHHVTIAKHHCQCPTCDKVFPVERYLRRHLMTHMKSSGLHECSKCQKTLKNETCLKTHMLIHSESSPFGCPHCSKTFNRKDKLTRHVLIHDPVKRYKCPFRKFTGCIKEFHRSDKLKAHLVTHTGIKPYKCQHCRRSFSRPANVRKHEQLYKGKCAETVTFSCLNCKECYKTKALLQRHSCGLNGANDNEEGDVKKISVERRNSTLCFKGNDASRSRQLRSSGSVDETDKTSSEQLSFK